jgi:glutamyl-Q tRNA(Asp) synthetase
LKHKNVAKWPSDNSETGTIATGNLPGQSGHYVGRFAPSPTGPLHFGSLIAATASYLEARKHAGRWLLRIENIDPPREQAGATQSILNTLEAFEFEWDGPVRYQDSSRLKHEAALEILLDQGHAYRCGCSRSDLESVELGDLGPIYPGTCRGGTDASATAVRVRTGNSPITFTDGLQGPQTQRLESESGDFIICRKDALIAYHLAVVVDDQDQGVTDIVRGCDLLDSTIRQIWLQQLLGYRTPSYLHVPTAVNDLGQKLSKRSGARGLSADEVDVMLLAALSALRQNPPAGLAGASLARIWDWALENWNIGYLRGETEIAANRITTEKNP